MHSNTTGIRKLQEDQGHHNWLGNSRNKLLVTALNCALSFSVGIDNLIIFDCITINSVGPTRSSLAKKIIQDSVHADCIVGAWHQN